jgi:uncharacterized protein
MQRVYLDTNVVIYYVEQHSVLFPQLKLRMLDPSRPVDYLFSDMVRLETRVGPLRRGDTALLAKYDHFFKALNTPVVVLDSTVFELATHLRVEHNLKTPDALHLAAAIAAGCDEFWTNDQRLTQAARGRIAIVSFGAT